MNRFSAEERIRKFETRQKIFAGIGLILIACLSVITNSLHLRSVAEQNTNFISRMVQTSDFREVVLTLQQARLNSFSKIQYESQRPGRAFVLPPMSELFLAPNFWDSLLRERVTYETKGILSSEIPDRITFEFNRFSLLPYGVLVWLILFLVSIPQTRYLKRRLMEQFRLDLIVEHNRAKAEIARTVRHNLRTPLAALLRIPSRLPDSIKQEKDLLSSTISQIKSLISTLDDGETTTSRLQSSDLYYSLLQACQEISIAMPSRVRFLFTIEDLVISCESPHIRHEIRSILGNIVNNSVDAISDVGEISLKAEDMGGEVVITIRDDGGGIPESIQDRIFEDGFSYGKTRGSGIGLTHAKKCIESWRGRIEIESSPKGTVVRISFPIENRAEWYVPRLKIFPQSKIVILDDQQSGRDLWKLKFLDVELNKQLIFLSSTTEFKALLESIQSNPKSFFFLFDYDLGEKLTGLDLLKSLPQDCSRFLVTGHFDQPEIQSECVRQGILMIPKGQIADLPIVLIE